MNAQVKASTNKTLFVSPSLITGLYTNTQVKGNGSSQTAPAVASVAVRVLLDCHRLTRENRARFDKIFTREGAGTGGGGI